MELVSDGKAIPNPLQLAPSAREFSDVIVFRSPPLAVQRATYPQLSRIVLAPRA
jgi:hypothetical protein